MSALEQLAEAGLQVWDRESKGGFDPAVMPINPIEVFWDSLGILRGQYGKVKRVLFGVGLGGLLVFALRPQSMFNADGTTKKWKRLGGTAVVPWWAVPLGLGAICGLLL